MHQHLEPGTKEAFNGYVACLHQLGSQQYTKPGGKGKADVFKDSIKHDFRSPCYTTRWSDIPEAT